MPKVTVLMAVYNGERYISESIESILAQTFQDFEFLIVNDGSNDRTRGLILSYDDPRIRLVDNEQNLGLARSLNRGLELAEGQFVARQDADDISEPERLARQVAFLDSHADLVLLGTWYKEIDAQGALLEKWELPTDSTEIRWSLLFFCPFVHSTVMMRKSPVLEQIGFYDESFVYAQDYDLWSRIARRLTVANLPECLLQYRTSPSAMTATYGATVDDETMRIRVANARSLISSIDGGNELSNEVDNMMSLLFDVSLDPSLEEASRAMKLIQPLREAFCQYYGIARRDCRTYQSDLCLRMGRRLVDTAHHYFEHDRSIARHLFTKGLRLHWPIVFEKNTISLCVKLLMGPRCVHAIRQLSQQ